MASPLARLVLPPSAHRRGPQASTALPAGGSGPAACAGWARPLGQRLAQGGHGLKQAKAQAAVGHHGHPALQQGSAACAAVGRVRGAAVRRRAGRCGRGAGLLASHCSAQPTANTPHPHQVHAPPAPRRRQRHHHQPTHSSASANTTHSSATTHPSPPAPPPSPPTHPPAH